MKTITFLVKPASGLCDMHCRYCFYKDVSRQRQEKSGSIMSRETAESLIRSAFAYVKTGGSVHFLFQGGEPTLAGLDLFRDFLALEEKYRPLNVHVTHSIQTNGKNLDEEWADLFRKNQFLVGLSLDGARELHDRFRVDEKGQGSWEHVCRALSLLDRFQVETNLLCVVTGPAAQDPSGVYRSLKQLVAHPLQFIPCLDPLGEERGAHAYSLTPQAYGDFLKGLFDCWYQDWSLGRYVSIRFFDDCIRLLLGMAPSSCTAGSCGRYLAVEANGDLYPCDFFMLDEWRLGNIHSVSIEEALSCPTAVRFSSEGKDYVSACRGCPYLLLCRGGCRRDWTDGPHGASYYYCASMKTFFDYALPRLKMAAQDFARMLF